MRSIATSLTGFLVKTGLLEGDLDYHLLRASMVILFSFIMTLTIIPFMPDGWAASAGGFPAMTGNVPFLMKDVVLLAVSVYLLKQDAARALATARATWEITRPAAARARLATSRPEHGDLAALGR